MRNSRFLLAAAFLRAFTFLWASTLLCAAFLLFFSPRADAQLQRNDSERQLFEALNRERAAQGLSALQSRTFFAARPAD